MRRYYHHFARYSELFSFILNLARLLWPAASKDLLRCERSCRSHDAAMPFQLSGDSESIPIEESRYRELVQLRERLLAGLLFEEQFEILISNCLDFERTILDIAANQLYHHRSDQQAFLEARVEINRKLINLLATCRQYSDQIVHLAKEIAGPECETTIKYLFQTEYDSHFEFRFMEALRNYSLHRGYPAHGMSFMEYAERDVELKYIFSTFDCWTDRAQLDHKFKRSVYHECPDRVDLKHATRVYVERLSEIHSRVRTILIPFLNGIRDQFGSIAKWYEERNGRPSKWLQAQETNESGQVITSEPMTIEWDEMRLGLIKRNQKIGNLRKRCVSGAIHADPFLGEKPPSDPLNFPSQA